MGATAWNIEACRDNINDSSLSIHQTFVSIAKLRYSVRVLILLLTCLSPPGATISTVTMVSLFRGIRVSSDSMNSILLVFQLRIESDMPSCPTNRTLLCTSRMNP